MPVMIRRSLKHPTSRSGGGVTQSFSVRGAGVAGVRRPGGGPPPAAPAPHSKLSGKAQEFWQADNPNDIYDDLIERGVVDVDAPTVIEVAPDGQVVDVGSNDEGPGTKLEVPGHLRIRNKSGRTYGHTYGDDPAITEGGQWLPWVPKFLQIFRATGVVRRACEAAGVNRLQYGRLIERSPVFKQAVEQAYEDSIDHLESLARHRAETSSDDLLKFMLRGSRAKFRQENREVKISGTGPGGSIPLLLVDSILTEAKELDGL